MRVYRALAITLILSFHFSVCTGNVFSVSSALAKSMIGTMQSHEANMTPAGHALQTCESLTPALEVETSTIHVAQTKGCSTQSACFEQSVRDVHDRFVFAMQSVEPMAVTGLPPLNIVTVTAPMEAQWLARPPDKAELSLPTL